MSYLVIHLSSPKPVVVDYDQTNLGYMDDSMVDTTEFKQWIMTDLTNLETNVLVIDEFVESWFILNSFRCMML